MATKNSSASEAASELVSHRWKKTTKAERQKVASEMAATRWSRIPKSKRAALMPEGGRPRKYPKCSRYRAHVFSPTTGLCPCGFKRPAK
jgi:hypothetical protein